MRVNERRETKMLNATAIFLFISWLCNNVIAEAPPLVTIQNGTLEGTFMRSRRGREFAAFRGIPYAQPPLDKLRFEPPKTLNSWTGVRAAKEDANICIQPHSKLLKEGVISSEDCLYLNVYSPKLPDNEINSSRTLYPVMIWLHGGGWVLGTSHSELYRPEFLLDHEIVLVTINYRLGPFGFLSTEDLFVPGNQGLKDQAQSIRWTHENIAAFGGDPNRITIFGQSVGGASVHYHMISPLSRGLFHRAISQSGTAVCPWSLIQPGKARNNVNRMGKLLNCPSQETRALVECLRKKDPVDLVSTIPSFDEFDADPSFPFRPVIEPDHLGAFIKEDPARSLKSGDVADVPWMTGITSHEGALRVTGIFEPKDKGYDKLLNEKFMDLAPLTLFYDDTCHDKLMSNVTKRIREFYFGDKNIDLSTKMDVVNLYTDSWFYIGADNAVRDHLESLGSPIYYYYFSYKGGIPFTQISAGTKEDYGVGHSDELQYLFPLGKHLFSEAPLTTRDHEMVDLLTRLWVNFAKLGNPTPEKNTDIPVKWKPVRTSKLEYLHIRGPKDLSMSSDLFPDRVNFWASLPYRSKIEGDHDDSRIKDEL